MSLFGTVALASELGVYALIRGDPAAPESEQIPPAAPSIVIEDYSTPRPTLTGPVHSSSGELIDRPSGRILGTVDGLYDIDTWSTVRPSLQGANRRLHEVVTTPVEDGGPDLQYRQRFARILDKWADG